MQIIDWIILGIIIVAALAIIVLVVSKWKQLVLIDIDAMPKAKLRSKKYQLIESRLQRRFGDVFGGVGKVFGPVIAIVQKQFQQIYRKLVALERKYRHGGMRPQTQQDKEKTRQKVAQLMEEGTQLFKDENFADAEQNFLDVIRLNPKEVEAYEYLGEIYIEKREFDHAIETLEYAKQLSPNDDRIAFDLGTVHVQRGDLEKGKRFFEQAVELAPNNPRNLNGLLQLAIDMKDKPLAIMTLSKLKKANPENQKLEELAQTVKEL